MADADHVLREAIASHVRDEPIIGDPELLNEGIFAGLSRLQFSETEG